MSREDETLLSIPLGRVSIEVTARAAAQTWVNLAPYEGKMTALEAELDRQINMTFARAFGESIPGWWERSERRRKRALEGAKPPAKSRAKKRSPR